MSKNYTDYETNVKALCKDNSRIFGPEDYSTAIDNALSIYSRHKPRKIVQEYTSDGTRLFALPTYWDDELSTGTQRVEYPVDATEDQESLLDPEEVILYNTTSGFKLRFRATENEDNLPPTGETFRVHYVGLHALTASENTIPDSHFQAFSKLAASELLRMMAVRVSQNSSGNVTDGSANYNSKEATLRGLSKEYREDYKAIVMPQAEEQGPSGGFFDMSSDDNHRRPDSIWPRGGDGRKDIYN
jgi:hypothetical protein